MISINDEKFVPAILPDPDKIGVKSGPEYKQITQENDNMG
jgi:hypothetical protein